MLEAIAEAVALKLERIASDLAAAHGNRGRGQRSRLDVPYIATQAAVEIPCVRMDSKLRFDRRDLDKYIDRAKREGV